MRNLLDFIAGPFVLLQKDRQFCNVTLVFVTLLSLATLISAIAIWPVVLSVSRADGRLSDVCDAIKISGIVISAISLLTSLAIPDAYYGFIKTTLICMIAGFLIQIVTLFANPAELPGMTDTSVSLGFLRVIVNLTLSIVLSIIPSALGCLAGLFVRSAYTLLRMTR